MKFDAKGDKYLTYDEFAEMHNVKSTTVRQWAHRGTVMVKTFGLRPYIWEKEPVTMLQRGRPKGRKNSEKV